jgi:hypothetical protein
MRGINTGKRSGESEKIRCDTRVWRQRRLKSTRYPQRVEDNVVQGTKGN